MSEAEAIMFMINNHEISSDDSFIMTRLLDFNGNQHDEYTSVEMIVDGIACIRNKLKQRVFELADTLDATIAKHAEEKAAYERQAAEKLALWERKCAQLKQALHTLMDDNHVKKAVNWRSQQILRCIHERKFYKNLF